MSKKDKYQEAVEESRMTHRGGQKIMASAT